VAPSDCLLLGATYKCTYLPGMQNFVVIGSGVSALQIRDFAVPFDVTSFHVRFFLGVFNKATVYTLERIFHANMSNNVVPGKEVPFAGHDDYI